MVLSAAERAYLRSLHDSAFTETCSIRPNVSGAIGTKGSDQAWPAVSTTVACEMLSRDGGVSGSEIDNTMLPYDYMLVFPVGTHLVSPYRIDLLNEGITVEVLGTPRTKVGSYGTAVYAQCVTVPEES